jgi:galactose mutarotase-like enzyme
MPFSIGAHPAFALPNKFENYAIAFERAFGILPFGE